MSVFANYLLRLLIRRELRRELLADLYRTINDEVSRAYAGSEAATIDAFTAGAIRRARRKK
jgi:hypothetical protein